MDNMGYTLSKGDFASQGQIKNDPLDPLISIMNHTVGFNMDAFLFTQL